MEHYTYKTNGVCSMAIDFDVDNGIVKNIKFLGGCSGNTQGVAALADGMSVEEVIKRCEGIDCRGRGTSCPDQLAKALKKVANA